MLGNTLFCRALTVLQSQNDKGPEPLLHQQTFDSQKGEVISRLISKSDVLFPLLLYGQPGDREQSACGPNVSEKVRKTRNRRRLFVRGKK